MVSALTTQIKWQEQIRLEVEKEKTRANLLRAVSHDIRTPLTAIQASASGILDNYDALGRQEKVELLEGIRDESQWLIRMVENLLSITRINGDRAQIQTTWEVVEEIVGGAVGKFQKQFPQIEVETSMPEEVVLSLIHIYLSYIKNNKRLFRTATENAAVLGMDKSYDRMFRHVFTPILDRYGVLSQDRPYIMAFYIQGLMAIISEWLENDCTDSITYVTGVIQQCVKMPQSETMNDV